MSARSRNYQQQLTQTKHFFGTLRPPPRRTIQEFAEQEVILPDGPREGFRYRINDQPCIKHWYEGIDSGKYRTHVCTAPTQSGKTLSGSVIPVLYHAFEIRETVIFGVPTKDLIKDKWEMDILPAIRASRYRDELPTAGPGSRGGNPTLIKFRGGGVLRFMSAGGSDKSVAGFTSRVVVLTEVDGFDQASEASREADKVTQMLARTKAYEGRGTQCHYMECTASYDTGRIWQEYTSGTYSKLYLPCPKCGHWVLLDRENLFGWHDAPDVDAAKENAFFACPDCGEAWEENEWRDCNADSRLVHRGQEIDEEGNITGDAARTDTFGFRLGGANNVFGASPSSLAAAEWRASRKLDEEMAEKEMRQFYWALPHEDENKPLVELSVTDISARMAGGWVCGVVPDWADTITIGIDVGKYLCHWTAVAWGDNACGRIIDYGRLEVPSKEYSVEDALPIAFNIFMDQIREGWKKPKDANPIYASAIFVDAGYQTAAVRKACDDLGQLWMSIFGREEGGQTGRYHGPDNAGGHVLWVGESMHMSKPPAGFESPYMVIDANYWKAWLHERLTSVVDPKGELSRGAMTLYTTNPKEHITFAHHMCAEVQKKFYKPNRGEIIAFERLSRNNHFLDSTAYACAAGSFVGVRLDEYDSGTEDDQATRGVVTPDGRPFIASDR